MPNKGNTCFGNALTQAIRHLPPLSTTGKALTNNELLQLLQTSKDDSSVSSISVPPSKTALQLKLQNSAAKRIQALFRDKKKIKKDKLSKFVDALGKISKEKDELTKLILDPTTPKNPKKLSRLSNLLFSASAYGEADKVIESHWEKIADKTGIDCSACAAITLNWAPELIADLRKKVTLAAMMKKKGIPIENEMILHKNLHRYLIDLPKIKNKPLLTALKTHELPELIQAFLMKFIEPNKCIEILFRWEDNTGHFVVVCNVEFSFAFAALQKLLNRPEATKQIDISKLKSLQKELVDNPKELLWVVDGQKNTITPFLEYVQRPRRIESIHLFLSKKQVDGFKKEQNLNPAGFLKYFNLKGPNSNVNVGKQVPFKNKTALQRLIKEIKRQPISKIENYIVKNKKEDMLPKNVEHGLIIKKEWLDKILKGDKVIELRGTKTKNIGVPIGLIESGSGEVKGLATIAKVENLNTAAKLERFKNLHTFGLDMSAAERRKAISYNTVYGWILTDIMKFVKPIKYKHPQGAIIWVKLQKKTPSKIIVKKAKPNSSKSSSKSVKHLIFKSNYKKHGLFLLSNFYGGSEIDYMVPPENIPEKDQKFKDKKVRDLIRGWKDLTDLTEINKIRQQLMHQKVQRKKETGERQLVHKGKKPKPFTDRQKKTYEAEYEGKIYPGTGVLAKLAANAWKDKSRLRVLELLAGMEWNTMKEPADVYNPNTPIGLTRSEKAMKAALKNKFSTEPYRSFLLSTGTSRLSEAGDGRFGIKGDDLLGKYLMEVRSQLKAQIPSKSSEKYTKPTNLFEEEAEVNGGDSDDEISSEDSIDRQYAKDEEEADTEDFGYDPSFYRKIDFEDSSMD